MLVIILFLITGVSLGLFAGKISLLLKMNERMFVLALYSLLFMLAVSFGLDDLIVKSLDRIGWVTFIVVVGSVIVINLAGWYIFRTFGSKFKRKLFDLS